jgi:hypothetical protein
VARFGTPARDVGLKDFGLSNGAAPDADGEVNGDERYLSTVLGVEGVVAVVVAFGEAQTVLISIELEASMSFSFSLC